MCSWFNYNFKIIKLKDLWATHSNLSCITEFINRPVSSASETMRKVCGAHGFNVKTVSPTYIAHFLSQDFSHFLRVFLVGVLLFTP